MGTVLPMDCVVIGAGVSGLSAGIRLRESGWDAHVVARELPEATVSAVAAAVWTMTELAPLDRVRRWALVSREEFARLSTDPSTGVTPLRQLEVSKIPTTTWWESTPWVEAADPGDLPEGAAAGWWVDGFMIETPRYLSWLVARFVALGGHIRVEEVTELDGLAPLVVNCAGLGAGLLVGDASMYPIRGQIALVATSGMRHGLADYSGSGPPAYVYPRSGEVVVGGTQEQHVWDRAPDPATTSRILRDARRLDPTVGDVVGVKVGLRPGRPEVRVEAETLPDGSRVIHDYGHGGSGYILSWGCADEVARLASVS
jgi:D-amino-acid oxidase